MSFTDWRNNELSLSQVEEKYQGDVPSLVILKIDVSRRGVQYTDAALKLLDPSIHYVLPGDQSMRYYPRGLTLRDGSAICDLSVMQDKFTIHREPYTVDAVDGKAFLVDNGKILEEVEYLDKPDFLDKLTTSGTPMSSIATVRAQRISVMPGDKCHFWDKPGNGCKFCNVCASTRGKEGTTRDEKYFRDVEETVREAIKQKGRFASFHLTSGSTLSGKELFDDEVELYIKTIQAAGRAFKTDKFPMKLVASAFNKRQLQRLYDETGITGYVTDIEVLDEKLFSWICPGKTEFVGYQGWKQRLIEAVDVFGRGQVHCGIVAGVETAQPNGYSSEEDALKQVLAEAADLGEHGISISECIWSAVPKSYFAKQKTPSLDYYVALAKGLAEIRRKNGLNVYIDDYRRCGAHPSQDMARID